MLLSCYYIFVLKFCIFVLHICLLSTFHHLFHLTHPRFYRARPLRRCRTIASACRRSSVRVGCSDQQTGVAVVCINILHPAWVFSSNLAPGFFRVMRSSHVSLFLRISLFSRSHKTNLSMAIQLRCRPQTRKLNCNQHAKFLR
jgi:hypothetical protein